MYYLIIDEKSAGECNYFGAPDKGRWNCTSLDNQGNTTNTCIPFTEQCDGKCYGSLKECGTGTGKCIPDIPDELNQASFWSCGGQCISQNVKCNGACPTGYDECGLEKCLPPGQLNKLYKDCNNEYCIPNNRPCDGKLIIQ